MADGSFSRIFLTPGNLNPALPQGELSNICEFLKKTISRDPLERQEMKAVTEFLRDLAASSARTVGGMANGGSS
ncbi:unnamed protein product, partial [Laminaria digitata]